MQVVLVSFRAEGEKRSFSVVRDITVIGRREDCDLRIPVSEVSRKHCRILKDGNQLRVEDLGSSNGTYHNGQRVQGGTVLNPGDSVQVGPVVFVVQIDGTPPDDELAPFTERAAHQLDDTVAPSVTAAALDPSEPSPDEIEENLEQLEEMPPESAEIEALEFDDADDRSVAEPPLMEAEADRHIIAMDMHIPGGGSIPMDAPLELDGLETTEENANEFENAHEHENEHAPIALGNRHAPIPLGSDEETPAHAPHASAQDGNETDGLMDGEIDFDLMEEIAGEPEGAPQIPMDDEDHLEIPLELHEEPEHEERPKHTGR